MRNNPTRSAIRGVKSHEPKSTTITTTVSLPATGGHKPNEGRGSLVTLGGSTPATLIHLTIPSPDIVRETSGSHHPSVNKSTDFVSDLQGKATIGLRSDENIRDSAKICFEQHFPL